MRTRDMKAVFGETPESYKRRVAETLRRMEENEMKQKLRRGFVPALVLMLLLMMGMGYAAVTQWGGGTDTRVEPVPTPAEPVAVFTVDDVEMTVTEVRTDGFVYEIWGELRALTPDISLIAPYEIPPEGESGATRVHAMAICEAMYSGNYSVSYSKPSYNRASTLLTLPNVYIKQNGGFEEYRYQTYSATGNSPYYEQLSDGRMLFGQSGTLLSEENELKLEVHLVTYRDGNAVAGYTTLTIPVPPPLERTRYEGSVRLSKLPLTIESVELIRTEMAQYSITTVKVDPGETVELEYVRMRAVRADGERGYLQSNREWGKDKQTIFFGSTGGLYKSFPDSVTLHVETILNTGREIKEDVVITK